MHASGCEVASVRVCVCVMRLCGRRLARPCYMGWLMQALLFYCWSACLPPLWLLTSHPAPATVRQPSGFGSDPKFARPQLQPKPSKLDRPDREPSLHSLLDAFSDSVIPSLRVNRLSTLVSLAPSPTEQLSPDWPTDFAHHIRARPFAS